MLALLQTLPQMQTGLLFCFSVAGGGVEGVSAPFLLSPPGTKQNRAFSTPDSIYRGGHSYLLAFLLGEPFGRRREALGGGGHWWCPPP